MRLIARGLSARRLNTVVRGIHHVPKTGPALIAARHYHHLFDGLALFYALQRRFHVLVTIDWVQSSISRRFMETITALARWPVLLREDALAENVVHHGRTQFSTGDIRRYQRAAIRASIQLLCEGRLLVVFPEGYPNVDPTYTPKRSSDEFLPFKSGITTIVTATERRLGRPLPVIPAGLVYGGDKPTTAHLTFGAPVYRKNYSADRQWLSRLETEVRRLSEIQG